MVRKATAAEIPAVTALALELWPDHDPAQMQEEFLQLVSHEEAALFLAYAESTPVGFAQCQLRHDYVEGTGSSPVGYLEGIFVSEEYRRMGYARVLLSACEVWAKSRGCREFASDCELTNEDSLGFHLKTGFAEANRIICFVKAL